jgi:hypothetical protein
MSAGLTHPVVASLDHPLSGFAAKRVAATIGTSNFGLITPLRLYKYCYTLKTEMYAKVGKFGRKILNIVWRMVHGS